MKIADLDLTQVSSARLTAANSTEHNIKQLASCFQLLYSPFIGSDTFSDTLAQPKFKHNDPARYDEANVKLGAAAELFHLVLREFHDYMVAGQAFADVVSQLYFSCALD